VEGISIGYTRSQGAIIRQSESQAHREKGNKAVKIDILKPLVKTVDIHSFTFDSDQLINQGQPESVGISGFTSAIQHPD